MLVAGTVTLVALPKLSDLLTQAHVLRKNYRGKPVPTGAGLGVVIGAGVGIGLLVAWNLPIANFGLLYLIGILGITIFGLFDDLVGDVRVKGLKGHLGALMQGQLTSGGLKAITGTATALFLSAVGICFDYNNSPFSVHWFLQWMTGAVLIALTTNLLNLADLRPGRASKLFVALVVITFVLVPWRHAIWQLPMLVAVLAYLPWELNERLMMGDTGANVLGIGVGAPLAWGTPLGWKIVLVLGLVGIHVLAERVSLSKIIENVPLFRRIDEWGRRHE